MYCSLLNFVAWRPNYAMRFVAISAIDGTLIFKESSLRRRQNLDTFSKRIFVLLYVVHWFPMW